MNNDIQALLESSKYAKLDSSESLLMKNLLENASTEQERLINEGTLSGDVAQFTPIILPLVRRLYPQLIANKLLGFQSMPMSTGYIYALVNRYTGTGNNSVTPVGGATLVKTAAASGLAEGDTSNGGTVVYVEDLFVLIAGATVAEGDAVGTSTAAALYTNEASFARILKGYTGSYTTAAGEVLGKDMREVGFEVTRKSTEARTRALKGQYTIEMYEDLKRQHGLMADEELMNLMSYEMQAEIDREVVDFVNDNATQLADSTFTASTTDGTGRWEIEKYRREVIRISKESAQIGLDTKRGKGNILLVSPIVATMLEEVGSFKTAEISSDVKSPVSGGSAGVFDNRYEVIVDQYAESDYCTVMYKGADRRDAMGFFAPYVPMSFTKVTNQDTGQPGVIAKTRYALTTIPGLSDANSNDRAQAYARSFGVNFANTILA